MIFAILLSAHMDCCIQQMGDPKFKNRLVAQRILDNYRNEPTLWEKLEYWRITSQDLEISYQCDKLLKTSLNQISIDVSIGKLPEELRSLMFYYYSMTYSSEKAMDRLKWDLISEYNWTDYQLLKFYKKILDTEEDKFSGNMYYGYVGNEIINKKEVKEKFYAIIGESLP